jgi:hypothetical protein
MNNEEKYRAALKLQKLAAIADKINIRHLGLADERCPRCGEIIETLLSTDGANPLRCCWKCESEGT